MQQMWNIKIIQLRHSEYNIPKRCLGGGASKWSSSLVTNKDYCPSNLK